MEDNNYIRLFQNLEFGIIYKNPQGQILDANPAAQRILGYTLNQMKEMSFDYSIWDAIKEDGTAFAKGEHPTIKALHSGKIVHDTIMGIYHPIKKKRVWINISAVPEFKEGETKPYRAFANFSDITDKQELQFKLQETEKKFKALFDNGPIGVAYHKMIYDNAGKPIDYFFLDANENYQKLTGIDPRGQLVTEAFPGIENDPSDWIGTFAKAGQHGKTIRFQQYLQPVDRWYDAVGYQSSPDHFVAAFFEITEQKKKEIELERLKNELEAKVEERTKELKIEKEKAEAANNAKTSFLANMSHELRTPLNAVLGYAEILQSKEKNTTRQQYLNSIVTSGKTLLSLINDVLDLSKIEAGKFELQYTPTSISDIFNDLSIIFNKKIIDKGLHWKTHIADVVPKYLLLDEMRLRQILLNLVGNALKFTDNGFISINCSVFTDEPSGKGELHLIFDIEDTGKGIEKNDIKRIFKSFEQAQNQKVSEYGGTGLGLAISKSFAEVMNGTIKVKSTPGKGSVFSLIIKHVEFVKEINQPIETNTIDPDSIVFKPAKVLIVDDIDYNRDVMGTYLREYNFDLEFANNGKQALECIEQKTPDIIILDMKMPVMTGYELSALLKESKEYKNIPIIAVTASSLAQDENTIRKHCEAFLRKPVSKVEIVTALTKFLSFDRVEKPLPETTKIEPVKPITDPDIKDTVSKMLMDGDMDSIVLFAEQLEEKQPENKTTYQLLKNLAAACNEIEIQKLLM